MVHLSNGRKTLTMSGSSKYLPYPLIAMGAEQEAILATAPHPARTAPQC